MSVAVFEDKFSDYFCAGPLEFIYEDDQCVAFDVTKNQVAPIHFLVAPKKVIPRLCEASKEDEKILGHLLIVAKSLASERKVAGYHVVVDEDFRSMRFKGVHLFGRSLSHMLWPTGPGCRL